MTDQKTIRLGGLEFANHKPMALFGGMNVLESRDLARLALSKLALNTHAIPSLLVTSA